MKSLKFEYSEGTYRKVTMFVDNNEAGYIEVSGEEIMYSYIEEEYRGKGFYKMLLIAALNLTGYQVLYSMNRNEYSNPCYAKWTGDEMLNENENIIINLDGEKLQIMKVSDC